MRDPYEDEPPPVSRGAAAAQVSAPGLFLLITSSLTVGLLLLCIPFDLILLAQGGPLIRREGRIDPQTTILIRLMLAVVMLLLNAVIAYGAFKMRRLENYRLAQLAAVLAMIPLCGPCYVLGIPAGIWALIFLARPEVREAFDRR